jgi:hypothetical protein
MDPPHHPLLGFGRDGVAVVLVVLIVVIEPGDVLVLLGVDPTAVLLFALHFFVVSLLV